MPTSPSPVTAHTSALSFTAPRSALAAALAAVAVTVTTHTRFRAPHGVLLTGDDTGALTVTADNYDAAVSVRLPDTVSTPGRLLVDHKKLSKLLAATATGERRRDAANQPVTVGGPHLNAPVLSVGGWTVPLTALTALAADAYPALRTVPATVAEVDRATFADALTRVLPAAGTDPTLPVLTGVSIQRHDQALVLATTDRYRLAVASVPATDLTPPHDVPGLVVPAALLAATSAHWTDDRLSLGAAHSPDEADTSWEVSFTCGHVTVVARTVTGTFPPYAKLLPTSAAGTTVVDRDALLARTRTVVAILRATGGGKTASLTVAPDAVSVAPFFEDRDDQTRAPTIPAETCGVTEPTPRILNPAFLLHALDSVPGPTVTLHTPEHPGKPVLITSTPDGITDPTAYRHLLMTHRPT